jgi:hypothetical protein
MRGELLLLPDPQQRLAELMPADQLAIESYNELWNGQAFNLLKLLELHLAGLLHSNPTRDGTACDSIAFDSSSSRGTGSNSWPAVSSAALQLSSQLLLQAAASWQQMYFQLSPKQQALLAADSAELSQADRSIAELADQSLAQETRLLCMCACLLETNLEVLRYRRLRQLQLLLLQQQGCGQVLMQGMTLAAHCGRLHRGLQLLQLLAVPAMFVLPPTLCHVHMAGTLQII